jgi:transcriptional regulator with GAF, ATPase, and Fis domain
MLTEDDFDLPVGAPPAAPALTADTAVQTLKQARGAVERRCIEAALRRAGGNVMVAARLLDTDRKWQTKLMVVYGIGSE